MKKFLALLVSMIAVCSFGMAGASAANVNYTDFSVEAPSNWTFSSGEVKDGMLEVLPSGTTSYTIYPESTLTV